MIKSLLINGLKPALEIIDEINGSEWQFWEMHYISLYKSWGFKLTNGSKGGDGQKTGYSTRMETKLKQSLSHKGKVKSLQHRQNLSVSHIGKKHTIQHRLNNSKAKIGKTSPRKGIQMSDEQKLKLSIAHKGQISWNKGRKKTEKQKQTQSLTAYKRKISKLNLEGGVIETYESILAAACANNVGTTTIGNSLKTGGIVSKKYRWIYVEETLLKALK